MAATTPYVFAPTFEREVLHHLLFTEKFHSAIGKWMEPEAFSEGIPQIVAQAIHVLGKELERAPGSGSVVVERIARWREIGRVTYEQVLEAEEYVGVLESLPRSDAELILSQLAPTIRRRHHQVNLTEMMDRIGTQQDKLEEVAVKILEVDGLGVMRASVGIGSDPTDRAKLRAMASVSRMPMGIAEIDSIMGGGPRSKTLTCFMGSTGDGKSMMLAHAATTAYINGFNTYVASFELADDVWYIRSVANGTGIPIDDIRPDRRLDEALDAFHAIPNHGHLEVRFYSAHITKHRDVLADIEEAERRLGIKFDLLIVDYADLVGHSKSRAYEGMAEVYGGLRDGFAVARDAWVFTASASRRKKQGDKQCVEDAADSQHKPRLSDAWIILDYDAEARMMNYRIAKDRYGSSLGKSAIIPVEFEVGRIVPNCYRTRIVNGEIVYGEGTYNADAEEVLAF